MDIEPIKENKIICRKCGGPHFTTKCGKEKKKVEPIQSDNLDNSNHINNSKERRQYFKITFRVKVSELPTNMTEEEMIILSCDWGHIIRLRVINYNESSVAYIDFGYEEEADYFIKAIDKTPFESLIISAQKVSSQKSSD